MLLSAQTPSDDTKKGSKDPWLTLARDAYRTSTDYYEASVQKRVAMALAHFQGRHAPGSKYLGESFKFRPKGFRPKTRAVIRRGEAGAAIAFFSTQDVVHIAPEDDSNPQSRFASGLLSQLVNFRLDHSIPWFLTLVGAYQDAQTVGVCISRQYWRYETVTEQRETEAITEDGEPAVVDIESVLADKPVVDLVPVENFRFAASADWRDPCRSSPYLIELVPYYVGDLREMLANPGAIPWRPLTDAQIESATEDRRADTTRDARLGGRQDPSEEEHDTSDFETVWVHRNIIRRDSDDWLYYTLGTQVLASDPVKLRDVYPHLQRGERDYVAGYAVIETHKAYPDGLAGLVSGLQQEANDICNQRRENVALVLNKRFFARRGARIDWKALQQSIPGGLVEMDDINTDIRWDSPPDVTSSAYEEQNRSNVDFDELAGSFSAGSVATNRQMNETVGGMNLLQSDSNVISEYQLRVFSETWVEPVLRQVVRMEQAYETDRALLRMAAGKENAERMGIDEVTPDMLQGEMAVRVNVGFGATKPEQRIQRVVLGLDTLLKYQPQRAAELDFEELAKEVLGALGYKGAERFFPSLSGNPIQQQLMDQVAQLQQQLESRTAEVALRNQGSLEVQQLRSETELVKQDKDLAFKTDQAVLQHQERVVGAMANAQRYANQDQPGGRWPN